MKEKCVDDAGEKLPNLLQFGARERFTFTVTLLITHGLVPFTGHENLGLLRGVVDISVHFISTRSVQTVHAHSFELKMGIKKTGR